MFPSNSPDITLVFRGLFLIAFDKEKRFCQFGLIHAEKHCLKIGIKSQSTSLLKDPELSFNVPDGNILFEVTRRASGVDTYEPGPFERNRRHDRRDFRWVLDFEGRELHNHQLPLKTGGITRSVFVHNGLFYTHDAEEVIIRRPIHQGAAAVESINLVPQSQTGLICKSVGCDIYLTDQEEFLFKYGPDGNYSMRLKKEQGLSYEISVTNLCEEQSPRDRSDFAFYYEVIEVPKEQQFEVLSVPDTRDDSNPCNPSQMGITKAILD